MDARMRRRTLFAVLLMVGLLSLVSCTAGAQPVPPTPTPTADAELSKQLLVDFFEHLHAGRYEEAARLYGGSYEALIDMNPDTASEDHAALLRAGCSTNGFQCLQVRTVRLLEQTWPTEFVFAVEFQTADGSLFTLGPCCGEGATDSAPQSVFNFRVSLNPEGKYLVQDLPPYMP